MCLHITCIPSLSSFFFFNDTATTEIYTLSLHDALPISSAISSNMPFPRSSSSGTACATTTQRAATSARTAGACPPDRKSTRLNSSHSQISYAVFCLKKKKEKTTCKSKLTNHTEEVDCEL